MWRDPGTRFRRVPRGRDPAEDAGHHNLLDFGLSELRKKNTQTTAFCTLNAEFLLLPLNRDAAQSKLCH